MKIRRVVYVSAGLCLLASTSFASEVPAATPLLATPAAEVQADVSGDQIAVVHDEGRAGWQLYLRGPEGKRKVNAPGTRAQLGGFAGGRLTYSELRNNRATIKFLDLSTGKTRPAPAAVNKRGAHEYFSVVSKDWLIFVRLEDRYRRMKVIAYNLKTRRSRVLFRARSSRYQPLPYVQPGQVSGQYFAMVVWYKGRQSTLRVYDLKKRLQTEVWSMGNDLWAPSITQEGVLYGVATGKSCGSRARLMRFALQRPSFYYWSEGTVLASLGRGFDSWNSRTYFDAAGDAHVLYQRSHCNSHPGSSDIWTYRDMPAITVSKQGDGLGTVTSERAGIDCGEVCVGAAPGGSIVTLTAEAGLASHFVGWSGACVGHDTTCEVTLDKAAEVIAVFDLGP